MKISRRLLWLDPDDLTVVNGSLELAAQGWLVDQARNLVEALDLVSRMSYRAVILDLQLPDALGTDAWLDIQKLQPDLIGIMTTDSDSLWNLIRVESEGVVAFLCKPLSMKTIQSFLISPAEVTGG